MSKKSKGRPAESSEPAHEEPAIPEHVADTAVAAETMSESAVAVAAEGVVAPEEASPGGAPAPEAGATSNAVDNKARGITVPLAESNFGYAPRKFEVKLSEEQRQTLARIQAGLAAAGVDRVDASKAIGFMLDQLAC